VPWACCRRSSRMRRTYRPGSSNAGRASLAPEVVTLRISHICLGLAMVLALLTLSACAAGPNEMVDTGPDPAGFWLGLWQGLISPITFLISLFTSEVNIYEVQNNGNWYDFGFILGVAAAFSGGAGGGSASAARIRRRR
jgi:hypothetical protein